MNDSTAGPRAPGEAPASPLRPSAAKQLWSRINLRDVGYGLLIACGALFVYLVVAGAHTRELTDANAMDYAQIARHLARGDGFTTSFLRPLSLAQVHNVSHHPDLSYAPLHPLWMSLFFRVGGANYRMATLSCGVAYLLTLPLVYFLAVRLFDRRCGLLALALFSVNYLCLQYALSGLEVSLATLAVTLLMVALYAYLSSEKPSLVHAALCGIALAVAVLVKEVLIVLLLPVLLAVLLRRGPKRWTEMVVALAAFALVMAPWGIRNARLTGNPLFSLRVAELGGSTITYKGQSLYRTFVSPLPPVVRVLLQHPKDTWIKIRPVTLAMYNAIPNLGGPFIAAFFIAGIFLRFRSDVLQALRLWHYAAIILVAIALCLLSADARMLLPMSPLVVIVGCGTCLTLLDRWAESVQGARQKRRLVGWGIGSLLAVSWFPVFAMTATMQPENTQATDQVRRTCLALHERKAHPIYSDQPWALAWYGDVDAIWLPQTEEDLKKLEEVIGPVPYLLLTPVVASAPEDEGLAMWARPYAAGRRGMNVPYQRFMLADALGPDRDWLLYGRVPEGTPGAEAPPGAPTP